MSWEAILWSETAPVADVYERAIISILARYARSDGTGAWPSIPSMARFAMCEEQAIRRRLVALRERGVIAYGDQSLAEKIPQHCRPKVYDLLIPYNWYSDSQIEEVDKKRSEQGLGPLVAATRPSITQPERSRKQRSDTGAPKPRPVAAGERREVAVREGYLVDDPPEGVSTRYLGSDRGPEGDLIDTQVSTKENLPLGSKSFSRDKSLEVSTHARDEDQLGVEVRGRPDPGAEVLVVHEQDLFGGDQLPVSNVKIKKPAQRDAEFDAFWRIYPKRVGKIDARRAWDRALTRVELGRLMAGAETYVRYIQSDPWRKQFTKDPATWLNKGCWDDELDFSESRNGHRKPTPPRSTTDERVAQVGATFAAFRARGGHLGLPGGQS